MDAVGVAREPDPHPHSKPAKILLVDDLPANLLPLEAVLDNRGYELVTATSGAEAIASTLVNDFAVILLDVMMPEMDGFQTALRIREIEQARRTPIIFVTAFRELEGQTHRGYGSGAVDFLYKPIDPDVLRFKVSVFADLQRQADLLKSYSMQLQATNDVLEQRVEDQLRWQWLKPFEKLAQMLVDHLEGILNYCRTKVPMGVVESREREHQEPATTWPGL